MRRPTLLPCFLAFACSSERPPVVDASAVLACQEFGRTIDDARDGMLTNAEARARFRSVANNGRLSTDPNVQTHARALLAASTSGTADEASEAMARLALACEAHRAL